VKRNWDDILYGLMWIVLAVAALLAVLPFFILLART
jgi:hypothetical protein